MTSIPLGIRKMKCTDYRVTYGGAIIANGLATSFADEIIAWIPTEVLTELWKSPYFPLHFFIDDNGNLTEDIMPWAT